MRPLPLIILAALFVALLIALAPFITVILILYGFAELIKHYIPGKGKKAPLKKEVTNHVNTFSIDFLRKM